MSKLFKVGAKVQRTKEFDGETMRGEIVAKNSSYNIDIKLTEGAGSYAAGDIYVGSIYFWEVIEEADELPPAPESTLYMSSAGRRKLTVSSISGVVQLNVRLRDSSGYEDTLGYALDPDAALQLAHDLRRMAMDIKRKEKANA